MKSKLLIYFLPVLFVMFLLYGYSTQDDPRNDAAPEVTTNIQAPDVKKLILTSEFDTLVPAGFPPTLWNYNYALLPTGQSAGTVGATYFKGKYINNRWNLATLYRLTTTGQNGGPGTISDSNTAYNGGTGAIRDLTVAPDGSGTSYLWGGSAATALYKMDSIGNRIATYTHTGASYRAIAWDPNRKGFWSANFTGNIVCRDTNGVTLGTLVNTLPGKYGMAFDSTSTADSAFLWVWSQGAATGDPNTLSRIHIPSNTTTRLYTVPLVGGLGIAGGAEAFVKDGKFILCLNYQNYAMVGYVLKELGPPPVLGNTLVLVHDTLATSTTQRKADRDTLNRYLAGYLGNYTMMGFDTNTVLPDLTNYNTIILQETSFDAANLRYLGVGARTQVKNWLASGTAASKKSLISIGADQGYNYSRNLSPAQDLTFAETYGKYIYRVDNAPGTASPSVTGVAIDIGNTRNLTSAPPGGSYWPDGCSMIATGSSALYKYQNHTALDTLGAIGNVQGTYVVATIFQDPRYFTGGFGAVLGATIGWVKANGGIITGVSSPSVLTMPEDYKLSQNYPNPFNPTTKIDFSIPKSEFVSIKIYDILGKEIMTLVNENMNAGNHQVSFDGSNFSSGTYFYRIETGNFVATKKMSLLK